MNKLVKDVADKIGISEEQAQKAVEMVVGYLKQKVPGPLAGHLDSFLGQGGSAAGAAAGQGDSAAANTVKDLGSKFGL